MTETRTVRSGPRPLDLVGELSLRTYAGGGTLRNDRNLRALRTITKLRTSRHRGSSGGWPVLQTVDKHSTGPAGTSHDPPL